MRLALTIAVIALGLTVVAAVTFYEPKTDNVGPQDTDQPDASDSDTQADASTDESEDAVVDAEANDNAEEPPPVVADAADDNDDAVTDAGNESGDANPDDSAADAEESADAEAGNDTDAAPTATYAAHFIETDGQTIDTIQIGSLEDDSPYMLRATISPYRAGLLEVQLADYDEHVGQAEHYTLLKPIPSTVADAPQVGSYAAQSITINGQRINLYAQNESGQWIGGWTVIEQTQSSVTLGLTLESHLGETVTPIAQITRIYRLDEGSYTVQLAQSIKNLSDQDIQVQWQQYAQGDITWDRGDYLRGRSRQYVLGYFNLKHDPGRFSINASDGYFPRATAVDNVASGEWDTIWPNPDIDPDQKELAWLASVNRYFTIVTSAHVAPDAEETSDVTGLEAVYPTIGMTLSPSATSEPDLDADSREVIFTLSSQTLTIAPGKSSAANDLGLDIFVGPRLQKVFGQAPYAPMRMSNLIRYSLGGMCGFCTFQWLADGLMGLLKFFHTILFDWGVAIILLVLIVRLCLHPITKRGQTGMMKMGKQMAAVQPEVAKLKKKYADNPQKMQQEQMKLFREKGINPAAGALGCLPMFLQMPIWIALYAMLYYAIELRHEPAFYGVFQGMGDLVGLNWNFLADLSRSDHFITFFAEPRTLNLLFIRLDYSSINVLPLLMAVTFYINMKFTTPPPANEQQAQQQKIMRIMPFLFPIMLYSAPSGLTLYIFASTAAGIIDSYIVRKHVKELEEQGKLFEKKPAKPGGIMHKIQMAAQRAQEHQQDREKQGGGKNKGTQNFKKKRKR